MIGAPYGPPSTSIHRHMCPQLARLDFGTPVLAVTPNKHAWGLRHLRSPSRAVRLPVVLPKTKPVLIPGRGSDWDGGSGAQNGDRRPIDMFRRNSSRSGRRPGLSHSCWVYQRGIVLSRRSLGPQARALWS
jgi:hypothetical protein